MDAQTTTRRTVALRPDAVQTLTRDRWATLTEAARACGIAPSTLARCAQGKIDAGPVLIAALLSGTGLSFDDLFVVVDG